MAESSTSNGSKRLRTNRPDDNSAAYTLGPGPKRQAVRKRAPLACEECRSRKRRCDGAVPICGGCTKRMSSCVYLAELQEKAWQHDMIQALRNHLKELEQGEQQARQASEALMAHQQEASSVDLGTAAQNDQDQQPPPPQQQQRNTLTGAGATAAAGADFGNDRPRSNSPISVSTGINHRRTGSNTSASSNPQPPPPPPPMSQTTTMLPAASTPWLTTTTPAPAPWVPTSTPSSVPASGLYKSPSAASGRIEPISVERLMRPIDQAISQSSVQAAPRTIPPSVTHCSCDQLLGSGQWSLPLRRHADDLVNLYFSRVHRTYPILHQPTFMRQYKQLWEPSSANCSRLCRQKSLDKTFPATVNAVFALAALIAPNPPELNSARAATFFQMTQKIDLLEIIDEEVGIELVQLLLLMGFYLQSTERFSKCWNITGLAIRMAQNMGLQLTPSDARKRGLMTSCATQLESEMRVRVWYGCVLLDREISMSFGRPLMINTHSSGDQLKLPAAIDDEHLSEEVGGKCNSQPSDCPSLLESYIQTIKLYDILGHILDREESKESTATGTNPDMQSLLELDSMIMEWRDLLPPYLQHHPIPGSTGRDGRALTPDSVQPTDFSAQAKRLHARFLHVRVLILRPALEHVFQKQRHLQPSAVQGRQSPRVAKVQDLMLHDIAAQCVLSADSLARCLDTQIKSHSLAAWWYNISYLHTCGSTLLMGRLCSFNESAVKRESLAESWELCLRCLSRYTRLSSIGNKSFHLLQESARRLLPEKSIATESPSQARASGLPLEPRMYPPTMPLANSVESAFPRADIQYPSAPPPVRMEDFSRISLTGSTPMLSGADVLSEDGGLDADIWGTDDTLGTSYWPFMPFLSQLESLPHDFNMSSFDEEFGSR